MSMKCPGTSIYSLPGHILLYDNMKIPHIFINNTIKGKGVSFMENKPEWHSKWLTDSLEQKALEEIWPYRTEK